MTDEVPRYAQWPKQLSASSAERFSLCTGSADLPSAIPGWVDGVPKPGNAASRGSLIHEVLAAATELSPAELRGLHQALAYFAGLRTLRRFTVLSEYTFTAGWLDPAVLSTVDVALHTIDELHIIDWKTGKIPVSPVDNKQLMFYAACAAYLAPKAKFVTLHVIQPWSPEWSPDIASHVVTADELALFMDEMRAAHAKIQAHDLTLSPGDHCQFCPANPHSRGVKGSPLCPAQMAVLYPERAALREGLADMEGSAFDDEG